MNSEWKLGSNKRDDPADPLPRVSREMEQGGSPVYKGRGFPALISVSATTSMQPGTNFRAGILVLNPCFSLTAAAMQTFRLL